MYKASYKGKEVTIFNKKLEIGDVIPEFILHAPDFTCVTKDTFKGKRKIIYTVPSLETDICSSQTKQLQKKVESLDDMVEITVSCDLPYALQRWCGFTGSRNGFVLSDYYNLKFARDYGVLIDELHLLHRAIFITDNEDKIIYVQYGEDSESKLNLEEVYRFINEE